MHLDITVVAADTAEELLSEIRNGGPASFVTIHCNADRDGTALTATDGDLGAVIGATSCGGAMTHKGQAPGFGAFVLRDTDGDYGSAMERFDGDPAGAAAKATRTALARSGRLGEKPELVWVTSTPGVEEDILLGIEDVVGADVPIIGGSAADNRVSGDWYVFDRTASAQDAVAVAVLFPSGPISFAYQNGYVPTAHQGTVTQANGRRIIEIDHRPARVVYAEWTGNAAVSASAASLDTVDTILSASTLWPLGRKTGEVGGVPYFLLAHPAAAHPSGALDLFASVAEGEVLTQMTGSIDGLVSRAGRVAALARRAGGPAMQPPKGALMVYCGGCRLSVEDQLDEVIDGVREELGAAPFLGIFTFGEQGTILGQGNRHGNLMVSCIVFGEQ